MLATIILRLGVPSVVHYLRELPLLWLLAGCFVAYLVLVVAFRGARARVVWLPRIALVAGLLVIGVYVAVNLYSLGSFMLQADEANILGVAAESLHGPMYLAPGSPDASYSLMYGPVLFVIYRTALMAGGVDHFWVLRTAIVLANLGLLTALYFLLRRFVSRLTAIALLAFPLSALLQHAEGSLGIRADIWIILCSTLALLFSLLEAESAAVLLTGLIGGILVGLKISAAPAILLPLLLLYRRHGLRASAIASVVAAGTALAPFALGGVSAHNYIAWILFTRSEGVSPSLLGTNLVFALFLLAPCLLMELFVRPSTIRQRLPELGLIVLCLSVAVLTSKPGSGPWYLWHLIPSVMVYLALACRSAAREGSGREVVPVYCIALASAVLVCVNLPRASAYMKTTQMSPDLARLRQSMDRYLEVYRGRAVQIGYGSVPDDLATQIRYVPVYRGQPYLLEGNTGKFETTLLPFPINVQKGMESCKDDVWLVPHGQEPFKLYIFPASLHTIFLANYSIDRSDASYDAWVCNAAKPGLSSR